MDRNPNAIKTRFGAWWSVIVSDIVEMGRQGEAAARPWWDRIAAWFRFVHERRPDARFSAFPGALRTAEALAIVGSLVLGLVLFLDPLFQSMLRERNPLTLETFELVTRLGASAWILYIAGGALLAVSLYPVDRLGRAQRLRVHDIALIAYFLFTSVAFAGLLTTLFKNIIGRARPKVTPDGSVWFSNPFGDNYDFASFPSGHATTAGALTIALMLLAPRYRVFFLLAGIWIAISRPVLGVHFPSDILAGFCFGAGFTYVYARSFARKRLLFAYSDDGGIRLQRSTAARVGAPQ
jgi:membrane-associated phospholipid phosphatase